MNRLVLYGLATFGLVAVLPQVSVGSLAAQAPPVLRPDELCSDYSGAALATFEDPYLEAAIRSALEVGVQEDLTCGLVSGLTSLDAPRRGIEILTGIQNLTSLEFLALYSNSISDMSALRGLTSLRLIGLDNNSVTDIGDLGQLKALGSLMLGSNLISDIGDLSGLTALRTLNLTANVITDITGLSNVTSLTHLTLDSNAITDIAALSGLTRLETLWLQNNLISDTTALSGLLSLDGLRLDSNPVADTGVATATVRPDAARSPANQFVQRVVLGNDVACRSGPSRSATVALGLDLGQVVSVSERPSAAGGGEIWYMVQRFAPCWVFGDLTAPLDPNQPELALLAIANYVLDSSEGRDFATFVRVHNLFVSGNPTWTRRFNVEASPILSLRRLELVSQALSLVNRWDAEDDPLMRAWILSQDPAVRYFEPAANWFVSRESYEELHERFSDDPLAEELLWAAARQPPSDDCEGPADCVLRRPLRSVATYWVRYPDGRFVAEAVAQAVGQLRGLVRCDRFSITDPPTPARLDELRATLGEVAEADKAPLLALLANAEAGCP